jgi:hypothetical protein
MPFQKLSFTTALFKKLDNAGKQRAVDRRPAFPIGGTMKWLLAAETAK